MGENCERTNLNCEMTVEIVNQFNLYYLFHHIHANALSYTTFGTSAR